MSQALHSVSVAGVIIDDQGRALVVRRRDNGRWEPPGGILEVGEPIIEGLRREVSEETGLDVEVGDLTGVYKNMARAIVALVFRCEWRGGSLTANAEVIDFRWMNAVEVEHELDQAYAVRIIDALADKRTAIRIHDGHVVLETD